MTHRIVGVVQHYAWGDHDFIPRLLGVEPDGRPWAELWLGTHPNGPSTLDDGRPLSDLTGELPYLLKILSCAEPLSVQAHPDAATARAGYERGIYADPRPKPELLVALTPFEALCGVRPVDDTIALLDELGVAWLGDDLRTDGVESVMASILRSAVDLDPVVERCQRSDRPEATRICSLAERWPGDVGVLVALLLNHVVLAPGEALRLDPGVLHAYLHGTGVELMGNSDNVVRGGLTSKPVDTDELLAILDETPVADPVHPASDVHALPAAGVALARIERGVSHVATGHELAIDLGGNGWYLAPGDEFSATHTTFVVEPHDPDMG